MASIFFFLISTRVYAEDELNHLQNKLSTSIEKIINLDNSRKILEQERDQIDTEINKFSNAEELGWYKKRKLVLLTEKKSELNQKMTNIFQKLLDEQNQAYQISSSYFPLLSTQMDSLFSLLDTEKDSTAERKARVP